jgi:PTH2 family peptidyl-tRNA hydrolase
MRTSSLLLALPALALAQDQAPLGGFFDKIKNAVKAASTYIPTSIPSVVPDAADAGAAKVAATVVHKLHLNDWRDVVKPSPAKAGSSEPEQWMVYLTGRNKTCMGYCENTDAAWNVRLIN